MTDYVEEQTNEVEALRSIYFDEFEEVDPGPPAHFRIHVKPDESHLRQAPLPSSITPNTAPPPPATAKFSLEITYTPTYPDEAPELSLSDVEGLDETETASVLDEIVKQASENLGMAMVFHLVDSAKESLEELIRTRMDNWTKVEEERVRAEEEAERNKYLGTKVTSESFHDWREAFMKERADAAAKEAAASSTGRGGSKSDGGKGNKLTGRQQFERDRTLAESDMALIDEGDVTVDLELFEKEMEDLDLEDEEEENAVLAGFTDDDD
ncbi:hypothetical protein HK102_005223 [Quaeritorhiza haematococci]|nr:hypothetical protein HK102_005223 [Quaeritorhiza haematococci]